MSLAARYVVLSSSKRWLDLTSCRRHTNLSRLIRFVSQLQDCRSSRNVHVASTEELEAAAKRKQQANQRERGRKDRKHHAEFDDLDPDSQDLHKSLMTLREKLINPSLDHHQCLLTRSQTRKISTSWRGRNRSLWRMSRR